MSIRLPDKQDTSGLPPAPLVLLTRFLLPDFAWAITSVQGALPHLFI